MADTERLLTLNRKPGERVPQRVLQREPDHDRAHRRGREQLVVEHERRHHDEQADDNEVLEDGGKALGDAIGTQRIDQGEDDKVDDRRGKCQLLDRQELRCRPPAS